MWCVGTIRPVSQTKPSKNIQQLSVLQGLSSSYCSGYVSMRFSDDSKYQICNPLLLISKTTATPTFQTTKIGCCSSKYLSPLDNFRVEPSMQVFRLLKNNKHDGFFKSPDVVIYADIIRVLCYWRMDTILHSLLTELVNSKKERLGFDVLDLIHELDNVEDGCDYLLAQASDAIFKALVSVDMLEEAIRYLCQVRRCRFGKPLLSSCDFLMARLVDCGKVDLALEISEEYVVEMIQEVYDEDEPYMRTYMGKNIHAYGIFMKALFRKVNLEQADDVFRKMMKPGMTLNNLYFTCIYVEELCSHGLPSRAEDILCNMEEQYGLMPDEHCYAALIHGYCQSGDPIRALDVLSEMRAKDIKTNCGTATTIVHCLCQVGMFAKAVDQFKYFQELGIYLDNFVYNVVIDALGKLGRYEEALKLLKEMKDTYKYQFTKSNFKGGAMHVFGQLKNKGDEGLFKPPNVPICVAIIRILCYWRMDTMLDSLLLEVVKSKKGHYVYDSYVFKVVRVLNNYQTSYGDGEEEVHNYLAAQALDAVAKAYISAGRFDEAITNLCNVTRSGFGKPLLSSCDFLLDRLVDCGNVDLALYNAQVQRSYSKLRSKEDDMPSYYVHAYGIVMKALFRKGDLEKAADLFRETIKSRKSRYNLPLTCIYVEELCSHGFPSLAEDVLRDMKKQHGVMGDEYCYAALIDGYCEAGDPIRGFSLWSEMRGRNIKTNSVIATTVVDCLHKFDMFGDEGEQPKAIEELSIYLDKAVDDALCKLGKI